MSSGPPSGTPAPPADDSAELDLRDRLRLLVFQPAVRNYVVAALSALAMIALALFADGGTIGAVLILLLGLCGIIFRWSLIPAGVLLILCYFLVYPTGSPLTGFSNPYLISMRRFSPGDLILVLSVLVYLLCHYRLLGLTDQAVPSEAATRRPGDGKARRPASTIHPAELMRALIFSLGLVFAGQLLWVFATSYQVVLANDLSLQQVESPMARLGLKKDGVPAPQRPGVESVISPVGSRFYLLVGVCFFGALAARVVFGYWRLRTLSPVEAAMILTNGSWAETHRERSRVEKWRAWGRARATSRTGKTKVKTSGVNE